jgi:predicted NAD-dependent protein-ADP-ribosyltransferase YbiA (DUF1768 family)
VLLKTGQRELIENSSHKRYWGAEKNRKDKNGPVYYFNNNGEESGERRI